MIWLYVGWRVLRRVRMSVLAGVVIGVVLIAHPQRQLERWPIGEMLQDGDLVRCHLCGRGYGSSPDST
jgi:hypothetical protein